jgi:hypothetical protein
MQTAKFVRRPFEVEAVQVTDENLVEVAKWCGGTIRKVDFTNKRYIKVKVFRPLNEKQTQAFPGDWLVFANTGYKVYADKAFHSVFQPADILVHQDDLYGAQLEAIDRALAEEPTPVIPGHNHD